MTYLCLLNVLMLRQRIKEWFRNHSRSIGSSRTRKHVLNLLQARKSENRVDWQIYSALYFKKLKPDFDEAWAAHKIKLAELKAELAAQQAGDKVGAETNGDVEVGKDKEPAKSVEATARTDNVVMGEGAEMTVAEKKVKKAARAQGDEESDDEDAEEEEEIPTSCLTFLRFWLTKRLAEAPDSV